jgi:ParB family chromosome partitioning protein
MNEAPVFIVAAGDGEEGRLVVNKRAERPGWALVDYRISIEEVDVTALRIIRVE